MAVTDSSEHQTPELYASSSSPDTVAGNMAEAEATNVNSQDHIQAPSQLGESTGLDSSNWRGCEWRAKVGNIG